MTGGPGGAAGAITIALPLGRLLSPITRLLEHAGLPVEPPGDRRLILERPGEARFLLVKPIDVPVYVAHGVADLGLAGKDVLLERGVPVAEVADLGIGRCRLVVAVPSGAGIRRLADLPFLGRVATKYPNLTREYFDQANLPIRVVPLAGSVELAPLVGLADAIVDLVQTGRTLQENGLVAIEEIATVSTRLVANPVQLRARAAAVEGLAGRLVAAAARGGGTGA